MEWRRGIRGQGEGSQQSAGLLLAEPETQTEKVNNYLCLTPHTHTHTSLLFLEVNILTHSLKLNFSSESDTVNNCK